LLATPQQVLKSYFRNFVIISSILFAEELVFLAMFIMELLFALNMNFQ